jgi:hypothetical protein
MYQQPMVIEEPRYQQPMVIEEPMYQQPMVIEQPMYQQPMMQEPMMMGGGVLGKLKLHLKEAQLQHNDGNFLDRMSPFVIVRINGQNERRSMVV